MLSLLRSMLTSISVALKDKNSLLSLFSVFLLRRKEDSGVWVEVLPFMGNKEDAWWGPGSSCVLSLENKYALTWDTSHCHLLWVYEVMSNLTVPFGKAQCAPLTAFRLKTGQYWGTWWWRNPFFDDREWTRQPCEMKLETTCQYIFILTRCIKTSLQLQDSQVLSDLCTLKLIPSLQDHKNIWDNC